MRFFFPNSTALSCALIAISLVSIGCNSDPSARREIGLLRAEIIDLEDNYALLKSKYEQKAGQLSSYTGEPVDMTGIPTNMYPQEVYIEDQGIDGTLYQGQPSNPSGMIFSRGRIYRNPVPNTVYETGTIVPGSIIYQQDNIVYPEGSTIYSGQMNSSGEVIENFGTSDTITPASPLNQPITTPQGTIPRSNPRSTPTTPPSGNTAPLPLPENLFPRDNQGRINSRNPLQLQLEGPSATQTGNSNNHSIANRDGDITEIVIHRSGTRGHSVDSIAGDEGISLLIQPKGSRGEILLQRGELTVSIIDPKEASENKRIGLWKFLPEETELFFVNDEIASHGILLHLPWDQATPTRPKLILHVRFVTDDGRVLQTSSDIRIKPPLSDYSPEDPRIVEWTQQDWRWQSDSGQVETNDRSSSIATSEDYQGSQAFELEFGESAGSNGVDSRWQQASGKSGNSSSVDDSGFRRRIRATPASTRNSGAKSQQEDEPQWRPVR